MTPGMTYTPNPIDTSGVVLAPEIEALIERIAKNTHELWAQQRLADGWSHGPRRDDAAKLHPGLRPYEELPETEKEYDRSVAGGALKAITALGYSIAPATPPRTLSDQKSIDERLTREDGT